MSIEKRKTLVKNASGDLDLDRGKQNKKKTNPEDLAANFDNFGFTSNQSPEPDSQEGKDDESGSDKDSDYDSEEPVDEESQLANERAHIQNMTRGNM